MIGLSFMTKRTQKIVTSNQQYFAAIGSKLKANFNPQLTIDKFCASDQSVSKLMHKIRELLFADYFCNSDNPNIYYQLQKIQGLLQEQIWHCLKVNDKKNCSDNVLQKKALQLSSKLLQSLPKIRALLNTDAQAAYDGDPACDTILLPILCYPSLLCLTYHRIAHELYKLQVPLLPRIISELAHSKTGIDIHPGAAIGHSFFIDHGTGVVIGETTIIGNNVKMYHGITLGAKSFPTDSEGKPVKGIKRHPIIGNNVTIYSNAVILGRIKIGDNSIIGGNVWITKDIPANSKIYQSHT